MTLKKIPALVSMQKSAGRLFAALPFSANQITVFSVFLAAIGFVFAYLQQPLFSLLFFILSGGSIGQMRP